MLRTKKVEVVNELKNIFNDYNSVIIFHYKGLNVDAMEQLRSRIYETGSGFKVIKNRLASIATKDTDCELIKDLFVGPTAMAWSNDPVVIPKILIDFAKNHENLKLVGGIYCNTKLNLESIKSLATMPSMDQIRSNLVALINAPATKIAGILQKPASMVVSVFEAYSKK